MLIPVQWWGIGLVDICHMLAIGQLGFRVIEFEYTGIGLSGEYLPEGTRGTVAMKIT